MSMTDDMPTEDEARQLQRDAGCTCECERVYDPERITAVTPADWQGPVIVFHHTWACIMTRIRWATWN